MKERITRKKAIRLKCLDCCCDRANEVRLCTATNCPLWRFRLGREIMGENPTDVQEIYENDSEG